MSSPGEIAASSGPTLVTHRQAITLYGTIGAFLALAGESGHVLTQ